MILVTGGAGFIGSHTCVELIHAGYEIVIADNFSNSSPKIIESIREITGRDIACVHIDVRDKSELARIFQEYDIEAAIHFAGYKAVGESVSKPLSYYRNNIDSALSLCEVMADNNVKKLIFSSSATVYRSGSEMPLDENAPLGCTNPYGYTKLMIEQILQDLYISDRDWSIVLLRYFNPIGAHPSGLIGERPSGIPNNLMPYITQTVSGRLEKLHVFGNDYPTADGTGVRDYIHVVDLANGHVCALDYVKKHTGVEAVNLGTGKGYSVLEVIRAFEKASGKTVPYVIDARRPGDIAVCYAKTDKAEKLIGWRAQRGIEDMCADAWRFERSNVPL
ncbi:MAG: UDP-glucose 4-epimerase GalE [Christensenellales bacterium]|jgi:UDP-glucose 4-epimerase